MGAVMYAVVFQTVQCAQYTVIVRSAFTETVWQQLACMHLKCLTTSGLSNLCRDAVTMP